MALEFKKLSEVTAVEEISDAAKFLVEDNGEIKRISKEKVIGGPAAGTVIFTYVDYEWSCSHTFEEFAEMYDNLTLDIVYIKNFETYNYRFETAYRIDPYDSSTNIVYVGDTANNAEYFMFNENLQFFRDGTISAGVPE